MKELGMKYQYIEVKGAEHETWIRHNPANLKHVFEFFNALRQG